VHGTKSTCFMSGRTVDQFVDECGVRTVSPYIHLPTDEQGKFTIHGDVYIHRFMHGEMLDERLGLRGQVVPIRLI
jgi:hypothetical protein